MIVGSLIKSNHTKFNSIWKQIEWDSEFSDYILSGHISDSTLVIYLCDMPDPSPKNRKGKKYYIIKVLCQNGKIGYSFKDYWCDIDS